MLQELQEDSTNDVLQMVTEDISTIPEEASEELRLEEEADAIEAALANAKEASGMKKDKDKDKITTKLVRSIFFFSLGHVE